MPVADALRIGILGWLLPDFFFEGTRNLADWQPQQVVEAFLAMFERGMFKLRNPLLLPVEIYVSKRR